jgi:hypothetical protein
VFREHGQAGLAPADQERGVVPHRGQAGDHPLAVTGDALAEQVGGQDDVAEGRVPAGLFPGVVIEPGPAVDEQNPGSRPSLSLVPEQDAGEGSAQVAVGNCFTEVFSATLRDHFVRGLD